MSDITEVRVEQETGSTGQKGHFLCFWMTSRHMSNKKNQWRGWSNVVGRGKQVQCFGCCIWTLEFEGQSPFLVQLPTGKVFTWMLALLILSRAIDVDLHIMDQRTYINCKLGSYLRCCWTCSGEMRFRPQFMAPELSCLMGVRCLSSHHSKFT